MPSQVTLKALGLNVSPNQLDLPDGSLTEASNVVIRRENVVESRRGFKLDGDTFGSSSDTLKQLFLYKERILRHYNTTLQFEDGTNNDESRKFTAFNGTYTEPATGLRAKSIEANGNFFFTTADGIKKISAKTADDLVSTSGYVTQAGGVKAIDLEATVSITDGNQTGFLPEDSAVAYRTAWATRDKNNNLIIGTPSQRAEVFSSVTALILRDFARLLGALDDINQSGSLITDGTYVSTLLMPVAGSPSDLVTNILSLASKIDNDILYANDSGSGAPLNISDVQGTAVATTVVITCSAGAPNSYFTTGSRVFLAGFGNGGTSSTNINGARVLTTVDATTMTFVVTGVVDADTFTHASGTVVSNEYRHIITTATTEYVTPLDELVVSSSATNVELKTIQNTLERIITKLQAEPIATISSVLSIAYILPLDVTTTSSVSIEVNIPEEVTVDHFLQVYRSTTTTATGTTVLADLTPNDEMQLIYEAYPTTAELSAKTLIFEDVTPDAFMGAYLYTNEATGEGALQANDIPPFAKDINFFKNSAFFANTKTRHKKLLSLLGVSDMITDYAGGTTPKLTIASSADSNTYSFVTGVAEVSRITTAADVADSLNGKYFLINSAGDVTGYYVWYKTSGGALTDPAVAGKTGIKVLITTGDTAATVATKTNYTIARYFWDFTTSLPSSTVVQISNVDVGYTTNIAVGTSGFTSLTTTVAGRGEDAASNEILLSSATSPAIAVEETAKSLVRVVNKNSDENLYLFYLSGASSVPGQMLGEARSLTSAPFYFLANNDATGASFNPDIGPLLTINSIATGAPTANLITTSAVHGLTDGDEIVLSSTSTTPNVDGLWAITYVSTTSFRINTTITVGDAVLPVGSAIRAADAVVSSNDTAPNRLYYSKTNQPEAVPIVNYFDLGASDKEILRIFPLRDSLFVFKEDGLYRVSGEGAPFSQTLFDTSFILVVPDSLAVCNSEIYGWTTQGISKLSEGGPVPAISRPIDVDLLKLATPQYTNFTTATFGIGYESDNSYMVWTVKKTTDSVAEICYRYSTLTSSWTTFDKSNTCGIVSAVDDKLYLGAGDINSMEQERKTFSRYDYSDREHSITLSAGNYVGHNMTFTNIDNISVGDVILQEQTITPYEFNMILKKLDADSGVADVNYYSTLVAAGGSNLRTKLTSLAAKLDADTGVVTTTYASGIDSKTGTISSASIAAVTVITTAAPHGLLTNRYVTISGSNSTPSINGNFPVTVTGASTFTIPFEVSLAATTGTFVTAINDFEDIRACFNIIIGKLNIDSGVAYANYQTASNTTVQEAIVTAVATFSKRITLDRALDFVLGEMTIFKSIDCNYTYAPQSMGDPVSYKQIREATIMFQNKAFTSASLSFSTDLMPAFTEVEFDGNGNGIFGHSKFGTGHFGGGAHAAPVRMYVPRNNQRCRFIQLKFQHTAAREQFAVYGITLTGEVGKSERAYR